VTLADHSKHNALIAKARRVGALVKKEVRQMVRDPSSIAMGVVLPVILILLFGYGLSLDVKNVKWRSSWRLPPRISRSWLADSSCLHTSIHNS